jgi:hypothetical protein
MIMRSDSPMRLALLLSAAFLPFAASAQAAEPIIVTAARTNLPVTALPLTAEVIDRETLDLCAPLPAGGDPADPDRTANRQRAAGAGQLRNQLAVPVGGTLPETLAQGLSLAAQADEWRLAAGLPSELLLARPDIIAA